MFYARRFDQIQGALGRILERLTRMALNFDRLTQEVAELKTVNESVVKLLRDTAAAMRDVSNNQSRIEALADEVDRHTTALAKAVEDSTTPAPEPVPLPVPVPVPLPEPHDHTSAFQDREDRYQAQNAPVQPPAASTGADSA